jgi:arylsulfatase A-like enzyme
MSSRRARAPCRRARSDAQLAAAVLALAFSVSGCGELEPAPRAGERASLLLVTVDTLRADHLGAWGGSECETPVIDRLCAEGVVWEQATTAIPITTPSLATLFTARLPRNHGALNNAYDLTGEPPTLATALAAAGRRTAAFLPSPLGQKAGFRRGFTLYSCPEPGEGHRAAPDVVGRALRWLERAEDQSGEPWFCWVHLLDPHSPYDPPDDIEARVLPPGLGDVAERLRSEVFGRGVELSADELRVVRALYRGEVEATDRALAPLFEFARAHASGGARAEHGPLLVAFTADHGELLGEHEGYVGHAARLYEPMLRVPLALWFSSGDLAGQRRGDPASLIDLAPTLLIALGLTPFGSDGGLDLLAPGAPSERLLVHETFAPEGFDDQQALRIGARKLLRAVPEAAPPRAARAFDVGLDPGEEAPLSAAAAAELEGAYAAWVQGQTDPAAWRRPELDQAMLDELEALGYVQGRGTSGDGQ